MYIFLVPTKRADAMFPKMTYSFFSCMLLSSMHCYFLIILPTLCASCVQGAAFIGTHHSETDLQMPYHLNKTTHLHFYSHRIFNVTALRIAGPTRFAFTYTVVQDSPLTETPDPASKLVGRAQGLFTFASQANDSVFDAMSFVFMEGKYNGSSLSMVGADKFTEEVREIPIVGGSKYFRRAQGYALQKSIYVDLNTGNGILEYNISVTHA